MQEVSITTEGIQKNLKSFKPLDALCEYIWNGFDAQADRVDVKLYTNEFGLLNMISIEDNGTGIVYEELGDKFKTFNDSKKYDISKKVNHSLPHGRQGIGRLTFFAFAQRARWNTVYEKSGNKYEYYIDMEKDTLNQYDDNGGKKPQITGKNVGTEVIFTQVQQFSKDDIVEKIKIEFFWFLELNKPRNFQILVDGEKVTYDEFIIKKIEFVPAAELTYKYEISIVQWNQSLGKEFSKFYFIDSDNEEKYKEATKLNKKSDEFFHSIFIKSSYFDNFYFEKEMDGQACLFPNKNEQEYRKLMDAINVFLYKFRRRYLKGASDKFIDKLIDSKIYPEFNANNPIDTYRKSELDNLVGTLYAAQPKIFTNLSDDNKKITIGLLKLIMDAEDKDNLFKVLKQVVDLDEDELAELAGVLKYTSLSNITRLVKLIEDRQKVIQGLKELVFNKDMYAKEVPHIQNVVENHYWLFGEQYNLITAAEPDFTYALKGLILATTGKDEDVDIDHEDKNKEMDIFMIRQDRKGDVTENVVVELKRPTVALGETQLSQVKKYLQVIRKDDRFNMGNVKWTFYLVGNKFNTSGFLEGELENNRNHGEQHLVYWVDNGMTKIYVLKWSEIFDEFSKRHEYLLDKLNLEEELWLKQHDNADNVVDNIVYNSATLEKPLIPKKSK
jgi:hypothetical protein